MNDPETRCPSCGLVDHVHVAATVWGSYTPEGFDSDAEDLPNYDYSFDDATAARCPGCRHTGPLNDFIP